MNQFLHDNLNAINQMSMEFGERDIETEICQRFVQLSCEKMMQSRGTGKLRRNLLILHLLRKARQDMQRVPYECAGLVPRSEAHFSAAAAAQERMARLEQRTASPVPRQLSNQSALWRWRDRRAFNYEEDALSAAELLGEEEESADSAPSCFLREPTMTVVYDADAEERSGGLERGDRSGRAVPDLLGANGRRPRTAHPVCVVNFGGTDGRDGTPHLSDDDNEEEEDCQPPSVFRVDSGDAVVPQQQTALSVSFDEEVADEEEDEEDYFTDEDLDYEEEALLDGAASPLCSSFRRRFRKRKPHTSGSRYVCVAQKRPKDADADSGVDVDLDGAQLALDEQGLLAI